MTEDKYALSESWARGNEYKQPFDYTLENSGQVVFLRRLDMGDLLKLGIAEQMDIMSKALMAEEKPAENEQATKDVVSNTILKAGNFEQMETMVNAVCVAGIIKPKLQPLPLHEAARQPGQIYIDSVPFTDRMELFSVIYDAEGLADFRAEQTDGVGNLADVPSVQLPADRSVDVRPEDTEGILLQSGSVSLREDDRSGDEQSGTSVTGGENGSISGPLGKHSAIGSPSEVPGDERQTVS